VFRDRPATRRAALASWVRWTVGPRSLLRKAASRRRRALEGPVRVCSPGVVATVARAAVLGERRVTSRRRRARSTGSSARTPAGAPAGRVNRLAAAAPTPACGPASSCGIGAGLRRGVDVTASRCFSWPVRSAPSVASKADATLGRAVITAFRSGESPQVSSLSHSRKRESCGAKRRRRASRRAALTRVY